MQTLQTERLTLRPANLNDAPFMLALLNDPSFIKYVGDREVRTLEQARKYILDRLIKSYEKYGFGLYITELKENKKPVGICGLIKRDYLEDIDVGFGFLSAFTGKGYGYESATAVLDFAKNKLGLTRIVGITTRENTTSIKLLEKLGLRYEKTTKMEDGTGDIVQLFGLKLQ